jgi:hypothetical protein
MIARLGGAALVGRARPPGGAPPPGRGGGAPRRPPKAAQPPFTRAAIRSPRSLSTFRQ